MRAAEFRRRSYIERIRRKARRAQARQEGDTAIPLMVPFETGIPLLTAAIRAVGTALVLGAAMLWVMPGASGGIELALMKLAVSLLFLFGGVWMLVSYHPGNRPDAFFDPVKREVRVLQHKDRGRPQEILRRSYDSLGSVRFEHQSVEICDVDGTLLMRFDLRDAAMRHALREQLAQT